MTTEASVSGHWIDGVLPPNAVLGPETLITGAHVFRRFRSRRERGLWIGAHSTMDGVQFAVGEEGRLEIGAHCYFSNAVLLCEAEVRIGSYVIVGWNTTITDSDFHPLAPALRIADALACSPLANGRARPPFVTQPVAIGDDVWIGPCATILKGIRIGPGAFVEPGAVVTRDVPPRARVVGNPARIVGFVDEEA